MVFFVVCFDRRLFFFFVSNSVSLRFLYSVSFGVQVSSIVLNTLFWVWRLYSGF